MKSLVVFDSNFGNTQKVAEKIADGLGTQAISLDKLKKSDLSDVDTLILGSPIIGWKPTVKTQEWLQSLEPGTLSGVRATTFDTRVKLFIHGDAKEKMSAELKNLGAEIFTPPEAFYIGGKQQEPYLLDGELSRASDWAERLKTLTKV